jgi:hypothetical protein
VARVVSKSKEAWTWPPKLKLSKTRLSEEEEWLADTVDTETEEELKLNVANNNKEVEVEEAEAKSHLLPRSNKISETETHKERSKKRRTRPLSRK